MIDQEEPTHSSSLKDSADKQINPKLEQLCFKFQELLYGSAAPTTDVVIDDLLLKIEAINLMIKLKSPISRGMVELAAALIKANSEGKTIVENALIEGMKLEGIKLIEDGQHVDMNTIHDYLHKRIKALAE